MEDKKRICELLLKLLQSTNRLYHLKKLEYDDDREVVTATFQNGEAKMIPAWVDSGVLMIKEIIEEVSR